MVEDVDHRSSRPARCRRVLGPVAADGQTPTNTPFQIDLAGMSGLTNVVPADRSISTSLTTPA